MGQIFETDLEERSRAASAAIYALADPEAALLSRLKSDERLGNLPFPPAGVHFERYFTDDLPDEEGAPGLFLIREFSRSGQLIHLERWDIFGDFGRCLDVKWDAADRVQEVVYYTPKREISARQVWTRDAAGRVRTIVGFNSVGEETSRKEFTRDAMGVLVSATSRSRESFGPWKFQRVEWDGAETRVFGGVDFDAKPDTLDLLYLERTSDFRRDELVCLDGEPVWCSASVVLDEQGRDLRKWAFRSDGIARYTASFVYGIISDRAIEQQSQSFPLAPEDGSSLRWHRWDERGRLLDLDQLGGVRSSDASGRMQAHLKRSHFVYDDDEQGRWWRRTELTRYAGEPLGRSGEGELLIRKFEDWD